MRKLHFRKFPFPGWLFLILTVLYHEAMLHLWVTEDLNSGRFLAISLFAIGFGAMAGLFTSFIPHPKWEKSVVILLSLTITVLWMTEYFISDAYPGFMTLATILGGAAGVATDFFEPVVSIVTQSLGQIMMMLLPTLIYAVCSTPPRSDLFGKSEFSSFAQPSPDACWAALTP